jgi:hypothetical protein
MKKQMKMKKNEYDAKRMHKTKGDAEYKINK